MSATEKAERILLAAIYFWGKTGRDLGIATRAFRAHVRMVARKAGCDPQSLDRAEKKLIRDGLVVRVGKGNSLQLGLTESAGLEKARRVKDSVALPPWVLIKEGRAWMAGPERFLD